MIFWVDLSKNLPLMRKLKQITKHLPKIFGQVIENINPRHTNQVINSWQVDNPWRNYDHVFGQTSGNTVYKTGFPSKYERSNYWEYVLFYHENVNDRITSIDNNILIKNNTLQSLKNGNTLKLNDGLVPYDLH